MDRRWTLVSLLDAAGGAAGGDVDRAAYHARIATHQLAVSSLSIL